MILTNASQETIKSSWRDYNQGAILRQNLTFNATYEGITSNIRQQITPFKTVFFRATCTRYNNTNIGRCMAPRMACEELRYNLVITHQLL